jgi:hypothetical protein
VSCFNLSFLDVPLILCFRICSLRYLELFEKAKAAGAVPCLIRNCEIANGIFEMHIAKHLQELALSSISASNVEEDPLTDPPNTLMLADLMETPRYDVKKKLRTLPNGLDDTYARILAQIPEGRREDARFLLLCMVAAQRPLKKKKLQPHSGLGRKT